MIWEGLNLMVIGMGTVFAFLILLVFCTQAMSRLIARFFPEVMKPVVAASSTPSKPVQQDEILAAVSAAVHHHRQRH